MGRAAGVPIPIGKTMRAVAAAALLLGLLLAAGGTGARAGGRPRNLSPPKLYGEFVAGRRVTLDPGRWSGSPALQFFWERCNDDGSVCKPAPDLGDETATVVRPHGQPGYDVGNRLRVGVTADHAVTFVWTALSPVVTAGRPPQLMSKGGIDPYVSPHVGARLDAYFNWGGAPRSVRYAWQRCGAAGRCVDIAGATARVYRVRAADVGSSLRVVSLAASGGGVATASQQTKPVR
jgi:hypothetical protein